MLKNVYNVRKGIIKNIMVNVCNVQLDAYIVKIRMNVNKKFVKTFILVNFEYYFLILKIIYFQNIFNKNYKIFLNNL